MQALLLPVGADWYAVELASVREVVPRPVVTPLPRAPAGVIGVFNLRGEVVPVFDTSALLGLGASGSADHVAVAETAEGPAGLAADGLPAQAELGEAAGPAERPGTRGRFEVAGRVATLLDVDELLGRSPG